MKLPSFLRRHQLSDEDIQESMEELRKLRVEVAVAELEHELRRSKVHVLRPKGVARARALQERAR